MPTPRAARFRLLAELPLEVAFKSITYRLEIAEVPVSGLWQLEARWPGGYWLCAHAGSEANLRQAVYAVGLELEPATMARTIFERLVKEGRAEALPC
jgi:hypothetical protein